MLFMSASLPVPTLTQLLVRNCSWKSLSSLPFKNLLLFFLTGRVDKTYTH